MSEERDFDNDLAGKIQQLLLPKAPPVCNWCCIGAKNRMAVVMSLLYGYIRHSVEVACSPYEVIHRANDFLTKFGARSPTYDHFFSSTLFFGVIVPETLEMHYISAAHPPPLMRRGTELIELAASAPLVGFFDVAEDSVRAFRFEQDDRLFLYTDGISETADDRGELFGAQRVKGLLQAHQGDHLEFLDSLQVEIDF